MLEYSMVALQIVDIKATYGIRRNLKHILGLHIGLLEELPY